MRIHRLKELELHHRIATFILLILLTVFLVRFSGKIYDPNPTLFGFEFHHFDYGMLILTTAMLLLLFGHRRFAICLPLAAIGFGLILDELWFVRRNVPGIQNNSVAIYNSSLPEAISLISIFILVVLIFDHFRFKGN